MKKTNISLTFLLTVLVGCTSTNVISNDLTGQEIERKFEKIQNFVMEYEVENEGPVLDNKVSIYKINKNHCVIVSKVDGDSGGYGSEDILYFYDSKFLSGYSLSYSYTYLNSKGTKKLNKPNYMEIIEDSENTKVLKNDFIKYLRKLNEKTLNQCSTKWLRNG